MNNVNYKTGITVKKGGAQLINIVSSTAFSALIALIISNIMGKEIKVETISEGINQLSGTIIFFTPVVSAFIRMVSNYIKNYKKKD